MTIAEEFSKHMLYNSQIQDNLNQINILKNELSTKSTNINNSSPFDFLQQTDALNLIKKNIQILHNKNDTMRIELSNVPKNVRKILCSSIHEYFDNKRALELQKQLDYDNYRASMRKLSVVSLVCASLYLYILYSRRR
tara:strand:- start:1352 stop:1765 length:414 start_codon:yes stop_codon:yes gene_type:complete